MWLRLVMTLNPKYILLCWFYFVGFQTRTRRARKKNSCNPSVDVKRKPCPMEGCSSRIIKLQRHLTNVHHMGQAEARLKITEVKDQNAGKYRRPYKKCPVALCGRHIRRVDLHLQKVKECLSHILSYNLINVFIKSCHYLYIFFWNHYILQMLMEISLPLPTETQKDQRKPALPGIFRRRKSASSQTSENYMHEQSITSHSPRTRDINSCWSSRATSPRSQGGHCN